MGTRQAVTLTVAFLVAMAIVVIGVFLMAVPSAPDSGTTPVVTIKSCPSTCEMLV